MMFLEPDEHIIFIDEPLYPFNIEDLKRIEDAGIKTIYSNCAICWDKIYKQGSPKLDWSSADVIIDKSMHTNLKVILPFYYTMPRWFPPSWYLSNITPEPDKVIPNYGSEELAQAIDSFANEAIEYYSDLKDKIHLIYTIPSGGEFLFNETVHPCPDEVIHKFIIDRQKVLIKQHGEIWTLLHNFLGVEGSWNGPHLPGLYQALKDEFKDIPFYSMQFAHFAVGNVPTSWECQDMVRDYNKRFGIKFFVGSQYGDGLKINLENAIKQNIWGFVTAPFGAQNPNRPSSIEPWIADNVREANKRLREFHGN